MIHNEMTSSLCEKNNTNKKLILIKKNILRCSICIENHLILYKSNCCESFVCLGCLKYCIRFQLDQCISCKLSTHYTFSSKAKEIIFNSISECPICKLKFINKQILNHFVQNHFNKRKEIFLFLKNVIFYDILIEQYRIKTRIKSIKHKHKLQLTKKADKFDCFLGTKLRMKNCDSFNDESLFHYNLQQTENNKIEIKAKLFYFAFCYYCEICNLEFCKSCLDEQEIFIKTKVHSHILKLYFCDDGWKCDGANSKKKCLSGITDFDQSNGIARYTCSVCNYDLCEECAFHYFDKLK